MPYLNAATLIKFFAVILTLCYPFVIYWGLKSGEGRWLVVLLILLLILRWFRSQGTTERNLTLFFAATLLVISAIWGLQPGLKLYPVLVNAGLLITFGITLYFPPTMIERFARIHEPNLSASGVTYTRHVTLAWCVFFAVNGLIALATVLWASDEIWLLYNGMISYCLIAALVAGEWLIRRRVKRRYDD